MSVLTNSGFSHMLDKIISLFSQKTHKHTVSDITDFPKSMPASDVANWAKAHEKPIYTHKEVGAVAAIVMNESDYKNLSSYDDNTIYFTK